MTEWKLPEVCDFHGRALRYGVSGDGPPVVVVHGTPWSSFNFRHIIKALSPDFTVHYYDLVIEEQPDQLMKKIYPFISIEGILSYS